MSSPGHFLSSATLTDEVNLLRNPNSDSGYFHVAGPSASADRPWQIREPFTKKAMGSYKHPREAATAVAKWYRDHFGPDWPAVFQCRRKPAFMIEQCKDGDGGYDLIVWELGRKRMLFPRGHRDRFASKDEARGFFVEWLSAEFPPILGTDFSWMVVRQTSGGTFNILRPVRRKPATGSPGGKVATCERLAGCRQLELV